MEAVGVESCWDAWCLPSMVDGYHPKASVEERAAGPAGRRTRSQSKAVGPRDMDHGGSPKLVQSRCAFPGHFACWPLWNGLVLLVTEAGPQVIGGMDGRSLTIAIQRTLSIRNHCLQEPRKRIGPLRNFWSAQKCFTKRNWSRRPITYMVTSG